MINPSEKSDAAAPQDKNQVPDSTTAICETLMSKLTEKDDKPKQKKQYSRTDKNEPVEISDSDESDKESDDDDDDEASDWSSATASPAPLKTPRAFEKSDHLYEKKMEQKREKERRSQEVTAWISFGKPRIPSQKNVKLTKK